MTSIDSLIDQQRSALVRSSTVRIAMPNDVSVIASGPARTVLMTSEPVGGVFTYSLTLATELAKSGTTVHVAMMGSKLHPAQLEALRAVPKLVVHETHYGLDWAEQPWEEMARGSEWLRALEGEVRPDIVHLNGYCHGAAGFKAPVVIVAHTCVVSSWEAVHGGKLPDRLERYKDAAKRGLRAAHAVIAVSPSIRASLERHYGPLQRTAVIPNGLAALASHDARDKEQVVVSAGRLGDRAKNIELLARVASRLPWKVKIAGTEASPQNLPEGVEALGWMPPNELADLLDRASIFVAPARYEPFGLSVLEAALHGCALVLGDIPSLRELWGDAATYVGVDDEAGLTNAIAKLAGDPALFAESAAKANLRAQLFTSTRHVRAIGDLYDTIAFARRSPVVVGAPGGHENRSV